MTPDPEFLKRFDSLPLGGYGGTYEGRRYRVVKTQMAAGRSQKLEAEELGGPDHVSFNIYRLSGGDALLKPCEMPADKVVAFVMGLKAD